MGADRCLREAPRAGAAEDLILAHDPFHTSTVTSHHITSLAPTDENMLHEGPRAAARGLAESAATGRTSDA